MTALVTGGSGYFGSLLVNRLLARGSEVRVLDLVDADDRPGGVELFAGDIRDADVVRAACAGVDVVFHNVAQVPLARDATLTRSVNITGTEVLLEACEAAGVRKVVATSSSVVFGVPEHNPVMPDTPPHPREPYGQAKLEAEHLCRAAVTCGLDVSIIRPRTILGHGRLGIFAILFDWVADGVDVFVLGAGDNVYQFVHADDLADACILTGGRAGASTYNIGAAEFGTMRETLESLCAHAGTGARVRSLPVGLATSAMRATSAVGLTPFATYHWLMYGESMWFDTTSAEHDLGWKPKWSNAEMFAQSYDWFLEHRANLSSAGASQHRSVARQGVLSSVKSVLRATRRVVAREQANRGRVDLVPVVLALVLVAGLVYSLVSLVFVGHPDIGWSEHVMADAKAIARGHFPYGDPGTGYVGMLYTPLFPSVVVVLLKITWWEGWGPFVSMVAVGVALVALGRFAWRARLDRREDRLTPLARVALVVALPLAAFTIFSTNGVFEGRTDQLAWSFFVLGALRVLDDVWHEGDRGVRGRVVTGLLLALSVLTKQTTIAACGTAAVVGAVAWWRSQSRTRRVPVEALTFGGVLVVVLDVLQVASDGFAFDLLFGVPRRHARVASMRHVLEIDLKLLIVPIVLVVAALVFGLVALRRANGRGGAPPDGAAAWWKSSAALTMAAAVIIGLATVPGSALAQAKQGGDYNALAGPVWGMALIFATTVVVTPLEWSRMAVRVIGAVLLVVGVLPLASTTDDLHRFDGRALGAPSLDLTRDWQTVPRDLVVAAEHDATVFDWAYPSYSVAPSGPSYPGGGAPPDLAAAGYAPRWIVRDLLDGRWDRVRLYPTAPGSDLGIIDIYASGYGQRDTAWAWKVNYLVKHGYTRVANARNGEDFYAPGPRLVDVQGLARCFGPYRAGALDIRVRDGGGLWCIHGNGATLRLDDGPNPTSELVLETDEPTSFQVRADDADAVRITCLAEPPGDAAAIRVRVNAGAVQACRDSLSLIVDVDAHVNLHGFRERGQAVRVRLHNPTPSEL